MKTETTASFIPSLLVRRLGSPLILCIVDKIAGKGIPNRPSTACSICRLFRLGRNRGYCSKPAKGIDLSAERQRRRLPTPTALTGLVQFAARRGDLGRGRKGSLSAYLWYVMDLAYLCRLRGIEVVTLADAHETAEEIQTNRRKWSRDNVVR